MSRAQKPRAASSDPHKLVRLYYANLELPLGASWIEVRQAYRRLVRSYHPDRHGDDLEKHALATELLSRLREAYEGLRVHLEDHRGG